MIQNITKAFGSYPAALRMIFKHGLWGYLLIPGLVCLVAGGAIFGGAWAISGSMGEWLANIYPQDWWAHDFFAGALGALSWISFGLLAALTVILFKYIAMIVTAPFVGPLSEKIESLATGQAGPKFSLKDMGTDILRAVRMSLRNIVREILWTLVFFIVLNFIPLIGTLLYPIVAFLIQAYYAGFGSMDPALERQRYGIKQRVAYVRSHKGLAIGNGIVFVLLMFVPVLGWFLAPTLGAAAATLDVVKNR
ncbi:MAG: EI24 domain-containing protein [Bacteroidia bacterium]